MGNPMFPYGQRKGGMVSQNGREAVAAKRIEPVVTYMRQHLDEPLQVSRLTTMARVSPSHFFILFKRATGQTPIDYFIHLRMSRACELLTGTGLRVKEIAAMLGYDDQFYFSRVFKSVNGVAPSAYRIRLTETALAGKAASPARLENGDPKASPPLPGLEPFIICG